MKTVCQNLISIKLTVRKVDQAIGDVEKGNYVSFTVPKLVYQIFVVDKPSRRTETATRGGKIFFL